MIVDTSALIAILRDEPEAEACARAIENSFVRRIQPGISSKPRSSSTPAVIPSPAGVSMSSSWRRKLSLSR